MGASAMRWREGGSWDINFVTDDFELEGRIVAISPAA